MNSRQALSKLQCAVRAIVLPVSVETARPRDPRFPGLVSIHPTTLHTPRWLADIGKSTSLASLLRVVLHCQGLLLLAVLPAWAGTPTPSTVPTGGTVTSGQAVIGAPTATGGGGQRLQIDQASQRAIIQWNTFDIGSQSEVRFNQPNSGASVLNRILDANPSVIQGRISANGQVYLINHNGILFDRGSQVNVHSLLATTLDMDDELFKRLGLAAGSGTPALTGKDGVAPAGVTLKGVIETASGGAVYVLAPTVRNEGVIRSPDGQVILAAGNVAFLYENPNQSDVSMRGLLVEVKAADGDVNLTSLVTNVGRISADRGNVTLAGLAVNQHGTVSASTAALQNGSVWLLAQARGDNGGVARTGRVSLGAGSVTETPIDRSDTTALAEDQNYDPYRAVVRVEGKIIDHAGSVRSPAGRISFLAYDAANPGSLDGSRIHLAAGSVIDAAGNWEDLALDRNLLSIKLTSNELKDAPVQKNGFLRGQTVKVDLRRGTPLFDISGYAAGVKRSVGEKATIGGDVTLESRNGDIIQRQGASIDVSGGGYRFAGGALATTQLIAKGRSVDISAASPDQVYEGTQDLYVQRYNKWGVSETFARPGQARLTAEAASVEGKSAGAISVLAPGGVVLAGTMRGSASAGAFQIASGKLPRAGRFVAGDSGVLGTAAQDFKLASVLFSNGTALPASFSAFGGGQGDLLEALPDALRGNLVIDPSFLRRGQSRADGGYDFTGFGDVSLLANDSIVIPATMRMEMGPGGSLQLVAKTVRIDGSIVLPSGTLDARGVTTTSTLPGTPLLHVGAGGRIDTRGLWLNESSSVAAAALPRLLNGGNIRLTGFNAVVEQGAVLDVSGGGALSNRGVFTRGDGGSLRFTAGAGAGPTDDFLSRLDGTLLGHGFGRGGTLDISTGKVRITDAGGAADEMVWAPARFQQGGFARYNLDGRFGLNLDDNTRIHALIDTLVLDRSRAALISSGGDIAAAASVQRLPAHERTPVSLFLASSDQNTGSLAMGQGARILTDPRAVVSLSSPGGVAVRGRIEVPAGEIRIIVDGAANDGLLRDATLLLAQGSELLSRGTTLATPSNLGLRQGDVLDGGQVTLSTFKNRLVMEPGAVIDVSAVSTVLDLPATVVGGAGIEPREVWGNAGSVSIRTTQGAVLEGDLLARAAGQGAGGGFGLDFVQHFDQAVAQPDLKQRRIVLSAEQGNGVAADDYLDAFVPLARLARSGFDKVQLRSEHEIALRGDLDVRLARALRLDAAKFNADGGSVRLAAPRVALGGSGDPRDKLAAPLPVAVIHGGTGDLRIEAGDGNAPGTFDLFGHTTLNGLRSVQLRSAGDLRFIGKTVDGNAADNLSQATRISGSLSTGALVLELAAARMYPTSATQFQITQAPDPAGVGAPATTTLRRTAVSDAAVMSVAGSLTITAPVIVHEGDLRAPLGDITLDAGRTLTVGAGSFTSVSSAGQETLFGTTVAGREWFFAGMPVTALPGKRISLTAPDVTVASGARLDLAGGGNVRAVEFIPGPGGSRDTLLQAGTFAILPGAAEGFEPFDLHLLGLRDLGFGTDRNVYDSVYLAGSPTLGLAAGRYTLLPAYYALLPGAFVVRPSGDARLRDLTPASRTPLTSGAEIIAGYHTVAGSGQRAARWTGFTVSTGDVARNASEYRYNDATFFARAAASANQVAPSLPRDAGQLVLGATDNLQFAGSLSTAPAAGGRIAEVDITAARIAITASATQSVEDGYLRLDAPTLSSFGASLMIGARRSHSAEGTVVEVVAGDIVVANNAQSPLTAPEILLAATGGITVRDGARLVADGDAAVGAALSRADLVVRNAGGGADGALVRLSAARQVGLRREAPALAAGDLRVSQGAQLTASGSLLLDATRSNVLVADGAAPPPADFRTFMLRDGADLALGASNIKVGFQGDAGSALVFDNASVEGIERLGSLRLRSYSSVDIYDGAQLGGAGLAQLEIDAAAILGQRQNGGTAAATLQARRLVLVNRGVAEFAPASADGERSLSLLAETLVLGEGTKSLRGFSAVSASTQQILMSDKGSLDVAADLSLTAARVAGQNGADQTLRALGPQGQTYSITLDGATAAGALGDATGLGARLYFAARSIDIASRVDAAAGRIMLESLGGSQTDGIRLRSGAHLNAGASVVRIGTQDVVADAGSILLKAAAGYIDLREGSVLDLSGAAQGGNAGSLRIEAQENPVTLAFNGDMRAAAAAGAQGRFVLDAYRVDDFSLLNARLNASGFTQLRDVRVRNGDITVRGEDVLLSRPADRVVARDIRLAADRGNVTLAGILDAGGTDGGGRISVYAGNDLAIVQGGRVLAQGVTPAGGGASSGGNVELFARDGTLRFEAGALVDISAGSRGDAGRVVFSARRTAGNDGVTAALDGTVRAQAQSGRAGRVVIEGRRSYDVSTVDGSVTSTFDPALNPVWGDYDAFMAAAAGLTHGLRNPDGSAFTGATYRAGIELDSATDLVLDSAGWNLSQADWNRGQAGGRLSLRSARSVQIRGPLGLANDDAVDASSWALRIVSGRDGSAADPLATLDLSAANYGDVTLTGATSRVRSTDGDIDIAAGRDFVVAHAGAVVMSTGTRIDDDARFTAGGGDISVRSRRDARGSTGQQWINDWLRRSTLPTLGETVRLRGTPGEWWAQRALFQHNLGAFGGGRILVESGRDIVQLSAMNATSGRVTLSPAGEPLLQVQGGGDLDVRAAGDIRGGEYLLARGTGTLAAQGDVGAGNARVALFVMGEHEDAALRGARMNVQARGDVFLQNVSNPTILPLSSITGADARSNGFGRAGSHFLTYGAESAVAVSALLGDINLANRAIRKSADVTWSTIATPSLTLASLSGDVRNDVIVGNSGRLYLAPSPQGVLRVLAAGDIDGINIEVGDTLASALPTWRAVAASTVPTTISSINLPIGQGTQAPRDVSVVAGARHLVATRDGDIRNARFFLSRPGDVLAGRDVINTKLYAQNLQAGDRSTLVAGRDIRFIPGDPLRTQENVLAFALAVGGPGSFVLRAGRDIDLGTSQGLVARGGADNFSLPGSESARLIVAAGATSDLSGAQADTLFSALLDAGKASDRRRADAAIEALFPSATRSPGNLSMVFSTIRTEGGSGIDILVPSGNIEAGLTTAGAGDIGIITTLGGGIRTFLSDDFNINQSKVLTVQGGDILAYSSRGSIDAGRGARDSRSTQPPRRNRDPNTGLTTFVFPVDVAGSGIRTLTSDPDGAGPLPAPRPGDVFLFAPTGTIDAGEAGIASAGNVVVVAQTVLNATNISASGSSTGVPLAPTTTVAASLASSGTSSSAASKAAEDSARGGGAGGEGRTALAENFRPTFISGELLGMDL